MSRWRPYLVGERTSYTYYPNDGRSGPVAPPRLRGQSFSVSRRGRPCDGADTEGVLFKQGAGHGGHVLFLQDGRLHLRLQLPWARTSRHVGRPPTRSRSGASHLRCPVPARPAPSRAATPRSGDISLYVDDAAVATLAGMQTHPGIFALAGGGICGRPQHRIRSVAAIPGTVHLHRRHHRLRSPWTCPASAVPGPRARTRRRVRQGLRRAGGPVDESERDPNGRRYVDAARAVGLRERGRPRDPLASTTMAAAPA